MQNTIIKYIGFYDVLENKNEKRNAFLSATNKMNYISRTLNNLGYSVHFISPSWTTNKKFYKGKCINVDNNKVILFPTIPWKTKLLKLLSIIFSFSNLLFHLLYKINKNDKLIIYYSRWLSLPLIITKRLRPRLELILEVEEIYDDVKKSKFGGILEYKLFRIADKYIFSTELLNQKLNVGNKPYALIYGTYQVEEDRKCKFNDGKIHVVYAGTFDPRKGGALAAAYLPKNFHVHIIGFGSQDDTNMLLKKIDEISNKAKATVTYDGLLSGEEYIGFLQKCDIGLSTQIPGAAYNETSFPSKILSYMANGLRVVSIRIKAIEISEVGQAVYYYDEPSPESIANAIISIDLNEPYDSRELIRRLDVNFTENIKKLLDV